MYRSLICSSKGNSVSDTDYNAWVYSVWLSMSKNIRVEMIVICECDIYLQWLRFSSIHQ